MDATGNLYGPTYTGGSGTCIPSVGCGTVFKLDTSGNETILHTFTGLGGDGANPVDRRRGEPQGSRHLFQLDMQQVTEHERVLALVDKLNEWGAVLVGIWLLDLLVKLVRGIILS
jgi:uncharacterized repeat protein (TIGR03803 family)